MARVVIGVPCFGEVPPEVLEDFSRFLYYCGRRTTHDYFLAIRSKSEQFRARNSIVDAAMGVNADYLFFLDDDMIVNIHGEQGPSDSYKLLQHLIDLDRDIVGALYFQRQGNCSPVAMVATSEKGYRFLRPDELDTAPQRVDVVGGGAMLINMRVFDKLHRPYFRPESETDLGTDVQICRNAIAAGYEVWLDPTVELGHLRQEREIVTSATRSRFMTDYIPGEIKRQFVSASVYEDLFKDASEYTGYKSYEAMGEVGSAFLAQKAAFEGSDIEWYRQHNSARVARQVWLNTHQRDKRVMVEYIIGALMAAKPKGGVLEFGCGIGVSAFALASNGVDVTACDVEGTGPLQFLKWRAAKHGVAITFHETRTEVPHLGDAKFDVITAMDVLEHLPGWRGVLAYLVGRLNPGGILFCNNGVLDDQTHPEHYSLRPAEFMAECAALGLEPFNQIGYMKKAGEKA